MTPVLFTLRISVALLVALVATQTSGAPGVIHKGAVNGGELKDLYYGEALFYAYQEKYFNAISRLDTELAQYYGLDEPDRNSLYYHIDGAEFSVGDFELYYRMHARAGRAMKSVIEGDVDEKLRNDAIYRLAKLYYQKQQPLEALRVIEKLVGELPEHLRYEEPFLRAQIYMATGKFSEAIELLTKIEGADGLEGYAGYNLAVGLFRNGNEQEGIAQLARVGRSPSGSGAVRSIQDKANLVLGFRLLESNRPALAENYLQRVRLEGPFSNKALLGAGWAAAADGAYDRALVPWTILSERNVTDRSVQEVLLGLPYAYGKLGVYGRAAILYGQALEAYSKELKRLDSSISSIREGRFLEAVVSEELKRDRRWLVHLRELPDAPETYYLTEMMASHQFQESLKNYFDLTQLKKRLEEWGTWLYAYEDIITEREEYYSPILPGIENQFRTLDSRIKLRTEQRDRLEARLRKMLISPRPELLITSEERRILKELDDIKAATESQVIQDENIAHRIKRLRGLIIWDIHNAYQDRFTRAVKHLHELDDHVDRMNELYQSFIRTRQAATQSYKGYDEKIERLRISIIHAQEELERLVARQGHLIEVMAINELEQRRRRIEEYQIKARFSMAESYDRATKRKQEQIKESDAR